jgi:streptogramin lyase
MKPCSAILFVLLLLPTLAGADRRRAVRPPSAVFSDYQIPGVTYVDNVAVGADGTVWFTAHDDIPPHYFVGYLETYSPVIIPVDRKANAVTVAAGAAWFGTDDGILRADTTGAVSFFPVRSNAYISSVTTDLEQDVWFTEAYRIGRIDTNTHAVTEFDLPYRLGDPGRIVVSKDNSVWFSNARDVGHLNKDGTVTDYDGSALFETFVEQHWFGFTSLAAATDGSIWVVAISPAGPYFTSAPKGSFMARISPSGEFMRVVSPGGLLSTTWDIAPSGQYIWIADCNCAPYTLESSELVALTLDGSVVRQFAVPKTGRYPEKVINHIALAPDGSFWVTYTQFPIVAKVVLLNSGL